MLRARESLQRKLLSSDVVKADLAAEVAKFKSIVHTYEKDQEATQRTFAKVQKKMAAVVQERDHLEGKLQKAAKTIDDHRRYIQIKQQEITTLNLKNKVNLSAIQGERSQREIVQKELNKFVTESEKLARKLNAKHTELELKMAYIDELNESLSTLNIRLSSVQKQLDNVSAERSNIRRELHAERDSPSQKHAKTTTTRIGINFRKLLRFHFKRRTEPYPGC